jgi:phosphatidylserine/phosphatidylglycerophosphate/cardiolipin synthase-like enzyme
MSATERSILADPGTHWRIATADRAALLIDGAAYFGALTNAMEQAQRSITIVGWDIRSNLLLEPEHSRETLADRLVRLLNATPALEVRLLIWDWVIAYSLDREFLPQWQMAPLHDRLTFVLDDALPTGASHHEKVVVIDGELAFVGGLDLSDGRWDTPDHDPTNTARAIADTGNRELPFHDVMMVLDGEAAAAVTELVERRWQRATDQKLTLRPTAAAEAAATEVWPEGVEPQLRDVAIAIARTRPDYADTSRAREIKALYHAAIEKAERFIYIENQYLTVRSIAQALAARLRDKPALELVIITPDKCEGALENAVMDQGRAAFVAILEEATRERVAVLTPFSGGVGIHVHAKVMNVDDRFFTMGSANLANRSMGVDSEINLAIEQAQASPVFRGWRQALLAEHLGVDPEKLAAVEEERGSIIASIAALNDLEAARFCRPLQLDEADLPAPLDEIAELGDPPEPIIPDQILGPSLPLRERRQVRRWVGRMAGLAGIVLIIASWQGPLAAAISVWFALPAGLVLVALWVAAERLWRPGLH